ncbi:MAG: carboxypeptidase-like regulatory domain-containing protein, partial [bacterium]
MIIPSWFDAARRAALLALLAPVMLGAQSGRGTIAGRVTAAGEGVPGVSVTVTGTGLGTLTRGDGTYRINLGAGRYEVRTRLIGYTSGRDSASVPSDGTATVNFSIQRAPATLEAVATLGTRGQARSVIDAPVPIDVLSAADIKATGRTETAQMIQAIAPSFNFPRTSIGDGTDH